MLTTFSSPCYTSSHFSIAMLDDARFYRSQGFSLLPLHGKTPALRHWKHLTERYPTDEELIRWFRDTRNNIAIICGAISSVIAFDADSAEMADRIAKELPPTEMRTRTAKGMHFFYRLEKGQYVPPRVRVNQLMLDVRGEASYVVAAPSIHPETQRPYERVGTWELQQVPYFSASWISVVGRDTPSVQRNVKTPLSYISRIRAVSGQAAPTPLFAPPASCVTPASARRKPSPPWSSGIKAMRNPRGR